MKNVKDIIKKATGKNLEIEESKTGYKIVDGTYTLTRGDAGRIEAGLQARGICARCRPGRFRNIWIKPSDRVIDNENDNTTKQGEIKMKNAKTKLTKRQINLLRQVAEYGQTAGINTAQIANRRDDYSAYQTTLRDRLFRLVDHGVISHRRGPRNSRVWQITHEGFNTLADLS